MGGQLQIGTFQFQPFHPRIQNNLIEIIGQPPHFVLAGKGNSIVSLPLQGFLALLNQGLNGPEKQNNKFIQKQKAETKQEQTYPEHDPAPKRIQKPQAKQGADEKSADKNQPHGYNPGYFSVFNVQGIKKPHSRLLD